MSEGAAERVHGIKHPAFAWARRLSQGGEPTDGGWRFLIEGSRMLRHAVEGGAQLEAVFWVDRRPAGPPWTAGSAPREFVMGRGLLPKLIGTGYDTSIDAVGVAAVQHADPVELLSPGEPGTLVVFEEIQDPMNVGVLLRTALGMGAAGAVFSAGAASPYSRRAVRSSTGAVLRLPLAHVEDLPLLLQRLRGKGVRVAAASARAETSLWRADLAEPLAVVFGNESSGVSETTRRLADTLVAIPRLGPVDSLNVAVAAGIVLAEVQRRRIAGRSDP